MPVGPYRPRPRRGIVTLHDDVSRTRLRGDIRVNALQRSDAQLPGAWRAL